MQDRRDKIGSQKLDVARPHGGIVPRPQQQQGRIAFLPPRTSTRPNLPAPLVRHEVPQQRREAGGGLGQVRPGVPAAAPQAQGEVPAQFRCSEPGCTAVIYPGPSGHYMRKAGMSGGFCREHWRHEWVSHPKRYTVGTVHQSCTFGARYNETQLNTMRQIVHGLAGQLAAQGRPLRFSEIDTAFRSYPVLRNEGRCPNEGCGELVTWWPDPRAPWFEIAAVE